MEVDVVGAEGVTRNGGVVAVPILARGHGGGGGGGDLDLEVVLEVLVWHRGGVHPLQRRLQLRGFDWG